VRDSVTALQWHTDLVPYIEGLQHLAGLDVGHGAVAVVLDLGLLQLGDEALVVDHVWVAGHHVDRVDPAVAHGDACEGDLVRLRLALVLVVDVVREAGDVVPAVGLPRDPQLDLLLVRELEVELLDDGEEVLGDALLGVLAVAVVLGKGEAGADRVVDEEHAVVLVPGGVAQHGGHLLVRADRLQRVGAHLGEEAEHARPARPALQPDHERRVRLEVLRREVPVRGVRA
jgi:hypothetical protein